VSHPTYYIPEQLTPQLLREASFSSSRLGRRGLDESEVREFCGWVSDEVTRMFTERAELEEEVRRLRERVVRGTTPGTRPEDAHVQAVNVLSKAQQTADRYVAEAQDYSREVAQDATRRAEEILRETKVRASLILEEAHTSGRLAKERAQAAGEGRPAAGGRNLETEIAYLRTFSDVCRTHLRAYLESLTRSIEEWESKDREGARIAAHARTSLQPPSLELNDTSVSVRDVPDPLGR
jgi:cell division septum initiation protein DivIVA